MAHKARICPVCVKPVSTAFGRFVEHGTSSLDGIQSCCDGSGTVSSKCLRAVPATRKVAESVKRVKQFIVGNRSVSTRSMPHGMASMAALLMAMSVR